MKKEKKNSNINKMIVDLSREGAARILSRAEADRENEANSP
jgi:hypothetical protein